MSLGSGTIFWEMGVNVTTIAFMVFRVMMNIGSLRELQAIFGGFLGVWLFNGIKYLFYKLVGIVGLRSFI